MTGTLWAVLPALLALSACGRYQTFTLPDPGNPGVGQYRWSARPEPVLPRGSIGAWDAVDTLNPSVVAQGGQLWNFYSGYDGKTWHTGGAISSDGVAWQRQAKIVTPDPKTWEGDYIAANGAALWFRNQWWYWYQGGSPPRVGLAQSADGKTWRKHGEPVLGLGPRGSWDERAIADPNVLEAGGRLYLYYLGEDRARQQRLGVAVSDDGITWTKHRANPLLEVGPPRSMDENGLGEPAVWPAQGWYWMLYTGRARNEVRRLALARSRDGIRWERLPLTIEGEQPWNRSVLCDPTVLVDGARVRVWFGGGDVPHPAENVHGQIGYGELVFQP